MHDLEVRKRFVQMRSQGRSFARIAQELNVSKQTLINCKHYIRRREKAAREDPEHFGPHTWERMLRQIEEEKIAPPIRRSPSARLRAGRSAPARTGAPMKRVSVQKRSSFGQLLSGHPE